MTKEEFLNKIREANNNLEKPYLTRNDFASFMGVSPNKVQRLSDRFFDKWSEACLEAGVKSGPNDSTLLKPNISISREECVQEIQRIAKLTPNKNISQELFKLHSKIHPRTIVRKLGSWEGALAVIGLDVGEGFHKTITNREVAEDFMKVMIQTKVIPTIGQMINRGRFSRGTYERKFDLYSNYKANAAKIIVDLKLCSNQQLLTLLEIEKEKLVKPTIKTEIRPHYEGSILGFRSFAYVPTYEQEVVAIFSNIAQESGFEILTIREEFPDCKARRKMPNYRNRYQDCLIEFELNASDFVKHKHPKDGCDLIVCWEDDWPDCPLEIMELKKVIKKLDGWK